MENKNNNNPSSNHLSPAHVPKLSAPDLWDRIQGQHARLAGDAAFVARLRAEGALTAADPGPLLLEYLRFAYLAWTMPGGATPSKPVDEAWHIHILFTRSYERFCRETRGSMLHHDPGGGEADTGRFQEAYRRTLERYEEEFGPAPPGYWPRPAVPKTEPPPQIPKPVPKALVYPAPAKTRPSYAFLLLSPLFAFVALLVTRDAGAALRGALLGAGVGLVIALIERRPARAAPKGTARKPAPAYRPPPPRQTRTPQPARTAKPSGRRENSSTSSTTSDTPYVPYVDAGPAPAASHHSGHHGHGDGGSHGGHSDGGSSGGDGGGGGSSCGSSCGGGGCGGG